MPGGLVALLDDVAALAKLAGSSLDDVAGAAARASSKAAGVVIDDAAVTPRYVTGLSPARELPIIGKIAIGSLRNKLLIILPVSLVLSAFAPWAITPLLVLGGSYLCFEGAEKIWQALSGDKHEEDAVEIIDPVALEDRQVRGAIQTDFILSAEIMAIALAELPDVRFGVQAAALVAVAIGITFGVYGLVAIIVKVDDIGLHMIRSPNTATQAMGRALVRSMPPVLKILSHIGVGTMLWVGGGILLHGFEVFKLGTIPGAMHRLAHDWSSNAPAGAPMFEWLLNALFAVGVGLVLGTVVVAVVHILSRRKSAAR